MIQDLRRPRIGIVAVGEVKIDLARWRAAALDIAGETDKNAVTNFAPERIMGTGRAAIFCIAAAAAPSGLAGQQAVMPAPPSPVAAPAPTPAPAPAPAPAPTQSAAMIAAIANRPRVKTLPEVITSPTPTYPESERAAGHGGTALVRGILGTNGELTEMVVARSTGFPALDAAAMVTARATKFRPARDADGNPVAIPLAIPIKFELDYSLPPADNTPRIVARADPGYPEAERAAGHHGKVEISGTLGPDGHIVAPTVSLSSKAPALDEAALAAARATVFEVARDSAGNPVLPEIRLPFTFDSFHSPGKGGGVLRYRCDQFVLDQDWWRATWPEKTRDSFYTMMLGLRGLVVMQDRRMTAKSFKDSIADFGERWTKAIEACRAKPEALFIDIFKPEGDWARRLAEKGF